MIDAGLPLADAVKSLSEQTGNALVKETLQEIGKDLENGFRFSEAIRKHPKVFNHVFVSVVASGEASGKLDVSLSLLADEQERDYGFRSRVMGALLYPGFIVVAMFVVGIIMVTRIVPALESVYKESNIDLPWTTKTVVAVTNSIIGYWYLYVIGIVVIVALMVRYYSSEEGRRSINSVMLRIPVVGDLLMDLEMARMTRILGIMLQTGVPIIQSLDSVSLVMDSIIYREALQMTARNVERGAPISQSMAKFEVFPNAVTEMIAAGEKTGKLDEVLDKLANFYEAQTSQATKNLASLVEPVVFVVVGLGVAFMVFSIIVPIYNLASAIK